MDITILLARDIQYLQQEQPKIHIAQEVTLASVAKQLLALLVNIVKTIN
jgi:hypothetical protein